MPRHSKKVTRRSKRKSIKGGYYSFNGALGTGAPAWGRGSEHGDFSLSRVGNNGLYGSGRRRSKKGGVDDKEAADAAKTAVPMAEPMGGRRRRLRKKGGGSSSSSSSDEEKPTATAGRRRRSKKSKGRRTMRGGNKYGGVAASYTGTGERGIANYYPTNTNYPPFGGASQGAFNNAGAQPGSGFANFVRVGP
jgi:hypothetical protein